jgi:hypothetical protein
MSLLFLTLVGLSVAMLIAGKIFFPRDLTGLEIALLFGGSLLLTLLVLGLLFLGNVHDTDVLSGTVISKKMERVGCRHSYECNCVTYGEGDNETTICQTCYEHPYDQDWIVHTTVGDYDINTKDSQGLIKPAFWAKAQAKDPVAREESVINYLKASPQSLFNQSLLAADQKTWVKQLPAYPRVHSYYEINRVATLGVGYQEQEQLNNELNVMLEKVGPAKQVNVVVVVVNTTNRDYKNVLERHWNGAKKNDVVVVLGTKNYPKIDWADAFSFAKSTNNELLMIKLRDHLEDLGDLRKTSDITKVIEDDINQNFNREPMSHFQYLRYEYVPSGWSLLIACLIYALCFAGAFLYCIENDVRNDD